MKGGVIREVSRVFTVSVLGYANIPTIVVHRISTIAKGVIVREAGPVTGHSI